MKKLFGTDGIRGKANQYPITPETALLVGKAVAKHFARQNKHPKAVLGKDTRLSGYMLESAISAGLLSMGMDVEKAHLDFMKYRLRGMKRSLFRLHFHHKK